MQQARDDQSLTRDRCGYRVDQKRHIIIDDG